MQLAIKLVDKCPCGRRGEFLTLSSNRCEIQISKARNKTVSEFAETLLHELLHFWITILQTHGLREGIRREHAFIFDVTPRILQKVAHYFRR
jgi:hypothetical protein